MKQGEQIALTPEWQETQAINQRLLDRERRWMKIFDDHGGNTSDYIRADFGTDRPKGLDIRPWPEQKIRMASLRFGREYSIIGFITDIMPFIKSTSDVMAVNIREDDTIRVNPVLFRFFRENKHLPSFTLSKSGRSVVDRATPHEFIHTRQNYRSLNGWQNYNSGNDFSNLSLKDVSRVGRALRNFRQFFKDRPVHLRLISRPSLIHILLPPLGLYRLFSKNNIGGYHSRNDELQARLIEMIGPAYAQWQKLPATKIELWAALHNLGIQTPKFVVAELNGTAEGLKALEDFKVIDSIKAKTFDAVSDFNMVYNYALGDDVKAAFWQKKYPMLYGELIEMLGDQPGRERMGLEFGVNPRPAIEVLQDINNHDGKIEEFSVQAEAGKVPASLAIPFLSNLAGNYPEGSEHHDYAMAIAEAVLRREDVRREVFAEEITSKREVSHSQIPTLAAAVICGNVPMVRLLMKNGADPFQIYTGYDIRGVLGGREQPIGWVRSLQKQEKYLEKPRSAPADMRHMFSTKERREHFATRMKDQKRALAEILSLSKDPDAIRTLITTDDKTGEERTEQVTLRDVLAEIGITDEKSRDHQLKTEMA